MKNLKNRIFNKKTTFIGIILFIISTTLLFMKVITFTEYVAFIPTVVGFIYVKDTILKKDE